MRKLVSIFLLTVVLPSLLLAGLALRALEDLDAARQREQAVLYQGVADAYALEAQGVTQELQARFAEAIGDGTEASAETVLAAFPEAGVVASVPTDGSMVQSAARDPEKGAAFEAEYITFLGNLDCAPAYVNVNNGTNNNDPLRRTAGGYYNSANVYKQDTLDNALQQDQLESIQAFNPDTVRGNRAIPQQRVVPDPEQIATRAAPQTLQVQDDPSQALQQQTGQVGTLNWGAEPAAAFSESAFLELVGEGDQGTLARFIDNRLDLMLWQRSPSDRGRIFVSQLDFDAVLGALKTIVAERPILHDEVCLALLDDEGNPVQTSDPAFVGDWLSPFVARDLGVSFPLWQIALYRKDPGLANAAARAGNHVARLGILALGISVLGGGWLVLRDVTRRVALARQRTDFVSSVSHELKTPLTSIRMFSELLGSEAAEVGDKRRRYAGIIDSESQRLTRLINNVLAFNKRGESEPSYCFQEIDLRDAVGDAVATMRPHLEGEGFGLSEAYPDEAVEIKADRDAVAQIVVNLLSNSAKYGKGEGRDAARQIDVRVSDKGEVVIADRGPGVPPNEVRRIFEPFYRAADRLDSGTAGVGLGLSLAREAARAHGGDLTYAPHDGGGSLFSFTLAAQA